MLTVLPSSHVIPDITFLATSYVVIAVLRKLAGKSTSNFTVATVALDVAVILQR